MRIAIFGHTGQIGEALKNTLPLQSHVDYPDIDVTDFKALESYLIKTAPEIIINAAAYTDVNLAESNKEIAFRTNSGAPEIMANTARELEALLIHYSTDYVFNGNGIAPWTETSPLDPLNIYGASKASGDQRITESGCRHLILRTSWVYSRHGKNFVRTIIDLARSRKEIDIVYDQIGAPTSAQLLAESTLKIIPELLNNDHLDGTYNICNSGETSWDELARLVFQDLKINCHVNSIPSSARKDAAQRPLNSRLDTTKIKNTFGIIPCNWDLEIKRHLQKMERN